MMSVSSLEMVVMLAPDLTIGGRLVMGDDVWGGRDQMISGSAVVVVVRLVLRTVVGTVVVVRLTSQVSSSSPVSTRRRPCRSLGPVHTMLRPR